MPRKPLSAHFRVWWMLLLTLAATLASVDGARSADRRPMWVKPEPKPVQRGELLHAQLIEVSSLINVTQARLTYGVNGSGLTAAVLDTGIRATHRDFSGRVVAQVNYTSDNGGNSGNANDGDGHGTNVAGIIAANRDHTGMAPGASIAALKVLDNDGGGSFQDIEDAISWVIANRNTYNITVVNMSLGDGGNYTSLPSDSFRTKLQTLRNAGVAVCAAAGNSYGSFNSAQGMGYPAIIPETVSVGAVYDGNVGGFSYPGDGSIAFSTAADRICPFSQRLHQDRSATNRTDFFAPGAAVTSTGITSDSSSSTDHGTSQATPVVAGVILLMQDYYKRTTGNLPTVDQLEKWLRAGAKTINDGDDENDNVNHTGLNFLRIDALAALQAVEQEIGSTYSISGTVTESGTGVSGVTVSTGIRSATTQSDGSYSITGLTSGAYTLTPVKTGYTFSPTTRAVTVSANLTGINFTATKTTFSIGGTVRTGSGQGLSGATLTCGTLTTTSDPSGNYAFTGLAANTYTVAVSRTGYSFAPSSQSVTVGPDKTAVDFTGIADQTPTFSISGTVLSGGSGLSGVTVTAGSASAVTMPNGTYSITGLPAASYTVTAARSGYTLSPASRTVVVSANVTSIDFTATQNTYSLSGTVRQSGFGLPGITVTVGAKSTTTDNSGQYTVSGLTAGSYTVTPSGSSYTFTPASTTVNLSANLTGVDFTAVGNTYRIAGRITQGSTGLAGITLNVGGTTVTTDASGNYSLPGLLAGSYSVQPTSAGYQFSPNSRTITVGPDQTNANFSAVALLQIQGHVTLEGEGVAGITIAVGGRSATTDSSGAYTFPNLPAGTYTLTPSGGGHTFSPVSRTVTLSGSNATGVDFDVVTNPHLVSLTPKVGQVTGGKSTSVTALFDRPVTANTYIFLTSSTTEGKVPKKVLLKKGRNSVNFSLSTKKVKSEVTVTVTGNANSVSKATIVTVVPKVTKHR